MDDFSKVTNVRAMINHFEMKCVQEVRLNREFSKSFSGLSHIERRKKSITRSDEIDIFNIEQQLANHILKTKMYTTYARDTHIMFQNELMQILANLSNIDTSDSNTIFYKKRELVNIIKLQFDDLNEKLPDVPKKHAERFGDYTYKRFGTARSLSMGGVSQSRLPSSNTLKRPLSVGTGFGKNRNSLPSPQISMDDPPKFDVLHRAPQVLEGKLDSAQFCATSPLSKPRTLIIGGITGTRHHQGGENEKYYSPPNNNSGYDGQDEALESPINKINSCLTLTEQEESELDPPSSRKNRNKTMVIGGIAGTKHCVGLNKSPEQSSPKIIDFNYKNSLRSSNVSEGMNRYEEASDFDEVILRSKNVNGVNKHVDEGLQSVNLLRMFFEKKSGETAELNKQESVDVQEVEFGYTSQLHEKQDDSDDNIENYENYTDQLDEEELKESETGNKVPVLLSRQEIKTEEHNSSVLNETIDETEVIVVESKFREAPDLDENGSISSELSVYVDPVD